MSDIGTRERELAREVFVAMCGNMKTYTNQEFDYVRDKAREQARRFMEDQGNE